MRKDAVTEISTQEPPSTLLAISSGQTWFTERQLAALQHMGLKQNTPKGDLAVFLHHCQRTGLDPFAKQIYMIERAGRYTIQTGIDGYRVVGDRVAERRGDSIEHADPLWAGDDGVWLDLWLSDEPPAAAKYTIVKNGKRNVATVMYREFVQVKSNGEPNAMWSRMPANQLAKCAEVQAWRKVYPNDFAGLVLEGAAQPDAHEEPKPARRVTAADILDEPEPQPAPKRRATKSARQKLSDTMFAILADTELAGDDKRDDRLVVIGRIADRDITSTNDLEEPALHWVVDELRRLQERGTLEQHITDILNEHALAQEERSGDQ